MGENLRRAGDNVAGFKVVRVPVQLVVYRDASDKVQFSEINPVTARLLALLEAGSHTGKSALLQIAAELQHPDPSCLIDFGRQLLQQLQSDGIVLGTLA